VVIGSGAYSEVYTARIATMKENTIAIKVFTSPYSTADFAIRREIVLLQKLKHPNIVRFENCYLWKDIVWAIMEFCDGGSLKSVIASVPLTERQIAYLSREILQGLLFLHQNRLVHRDIKSDNILLFLDGRVKIGDLGICAEVQGSDIEPLPMAGSRCWIAPEVLQSRPYGFKADVYSFGCLVLEMANGCAPYVEETPLRNMLLTATKGAPGFYQPDKWSAEFRDFARQCLHMNPFARATVAELLQHPFLADVSLQDIIPAMQVAFINNSLINVGLL